MPWIGIDNVWHTLGIFLMESPGLQANGASVRRSVGFYDKGLILDQYALMNRRYFPQGTNVIAAVEQLLAMAGISKTNLAASDAEIYSDIEFPIGTNVLQATNELLTSINFGTLSFDEMGIAVARQYVFPGRRVIDRFYSSQTDSIITPEYSDLLDIASAPNVFIRCADGAELPAPLVSIFINDSPAISTSTVNRGRQIVDFARVGNVFTQDQLDASVKRAAIEATQAYRYLDFKTLLMPHGGGDALYIDMPELFDVPMMFIETAWNMDLRAGGLMSHHAKVVVDI
jgi:hypothetical protein